MKWKVLIIIDIYWYKEEKKTKPGQNEMNRISNDLLDLSHFSEHVYILN